MILLKRIFFIIISFCFFQQISFSQSNITLIYLHGSNGNTYENKKWFENGVSRLHPVLKKALEGKVKGEKINPAISDYVINKKPEIFLWGANAEVAMESMLNRLNATRFVSAPGAFWAKKFLSSELHDAVWIVKTRHFLPVLDDLNQRVIQEYNKGNKVILSGFSMGSFITFKYLIFKLRYLDVKQAFTDLKIDDEETLNFVKEHPQENTCLSAITDGGIGNIGIDGNFRLNKDRDKFRQSYLNLKQLSDKYCAPKDSVLGVINYGSPLAIFNSEYEDEGYEFVVYSNYLSNSILDNGLFFITVNFIEDPLGFPLKLDGKTPPENNQSSRGLIYDNYSVKSWRWFVIAHLSYFNARKIFPREVVKSFNAER